MKGPKTSSGYDVGYRRPPRPSRFQKGRSGNPFGRPRGSKRRLLYDDVLGQMVTVYYIGRERRVSAEIAFLMHLRQQALGGDASARRSLLRVNKVLRPSTPFGVRVTSFIEVGFVTPGNVDTALEALRMARVLDRFRDGARIVLEPEVVEDQLTRFGERRLTLEQQRVVVDATRTPHKVKWPDWWEVEVRE